VNVSTEASAPGRSRTETRRRLVAAATELFARDGLHAVTSHAIAEAAGVASGTFYLHFPDKRSLFEEIARGAMDGLGERLARVSREAAGVEAAVHARSVELCAFAGANRDLVRILFGRGAEAGDLASEILDDFVATLRGRMDEQIAAGVFDRNLHPGVAAQAVVGMLARVIGWWVEEPQRAARRDVVETLSRIQLYGLRPPAGIGIAPDRGI
jgi:AcrR family transcriptional regulator